MKLLLEVTADDIAHGLEQNCHHCPIAIALVSKFPESCTRYVSYTSCASRNLLVIFPYGFYKQIKTTPPIKDFIREFDSGQPVQPTTFELDYE